jgi:hypothetical protein
MALKYHNGLKIPTEMAIKYTKNVHFKAFKDNLTLGFFV